MHGEGFVLVDDLEVVEDVGVVQLVVDALVEGQRLSPPLVTVPVHGRICAEISKGELRLRSEYKILLTRV